MKKYFLATLLVLLILSLIGCSSNEVQFPDIVKGEITKISSRHSGSGLLYSITDKEKIAHFVRIMNSTTYSKVKAYEPVAGNSGLVLYNGNNEKNNKYNFKW